MSHNEMGGSCVIAALEFVIEIHRERV